MVPRQHLEFNLFARNKKRFMDDQERILQDMPLLKEMHKGSVKAFEILIDKYITLISRTSFRILCDRSDSEAVTEKVFVQLWYDAMSYDDRYTLAEWLLRRTCIYSRLRISRRRMLCLAGLRPELFALSKPKVGNTDDFIATMAWEIFCRASARMTPLQRIVFSLVELEQLPDYKVASITGLFNFRVGIALRRARQKLTAELKHLGKQDDYDKYVGFIRRISDSLIDLKRLNGEIIRLCS